MAGPKESIPVFYTQDLIVRGCKVLQGGQAWSKSKIETC